MPGKGIVTASPRSLQIGKTVKPKCTLFIFLIFCVVMRQKLVCANPDGLRLELVQVIFRHGEKTPVNAFPNNPHENETYYPYGLGSLDKVGRQSSYNLGLYLKNLYRDFIFGYDPKKVTIWSSNTSRTKTCAALVAAGLFPPNGRKWDVPGGLGNIWIPVPIDSIDNPLNDRNSNHGHRFSCPAYFQMIHEQNNGPFFDWLVQSDPELVQAFMENTGSRDIYTIPDILDTLEIHDRYGLKIVDWAKPFYPDRLKAFSEKVFYMFVRTDEMTRLRIGAFLKHIIQQMDLKSSGSNQKFWLYSGHDLIISNLGRALGVWKSYLAEYSSAMIIELLSNSLEQHFVSIYMHNDTSKIPTRLTVPGCGTLCPLNQFRRLFDKLLPADPIEECSRVDKDGERFLHPPDGWLF